MEKEKKAIIMGDPISVMELMEVRGGAGTSSRLCLFRVGVRCTGTPATTEETKCKGKSKATSSSEKEYKCRGVRRGVKCTGSHMAVVTCSGTSAIASY